MSATFLIRVTPRIASASERVAIPRSRPGPQRGYVQAPIQIRAVRMTISVAATLPHTSPGPASGSGTGLARPSPASPESTPERLRQKAPPTGDEIDGPGPGPSPDLLSGHVQPAPTARLARDRPTCTPSTSPSSSRAQASAAGSHVHGYGSF